MSESVSDIQSHVQGKVGSQANKEYVLTIRVWSQSCLLSSTKGKTNKIKWKKRSMQNSTVLTATFKHLFQREDTKGQDTKGNMQTKSQCHMKKKANI